VRLAPTPSFFLKSRECHKTDLALSSNSKYYKIIQADFAILFCYYYFAFSVFPVVFKCFQLCNIFYK